MSRPRAAASAARSRPSRAFSPTNSRVSRPVAGAYSNATAAPAIAPSMNASSTVPAPPDVASFASVAIRESSCHWLLEDTDSHVEISLRILLDCRHEIAHVVHGGIHVLI